MKNQTPSIKQTTPIKVVRILFYGSLIVAASTTTSGYITQFPTTSWQTWREPLIAWAIIALTILAEALGHGNKVIGPMVAGFNVLLAVGLWRNIRPIHALIAGAAALSAWDLYHFKAWLDRADHINASAALVKTHIRRLGFAMGLGVLVGSVGLGIRLQYGLGTIMLLGLVLVLGLSRIIRFLRRESD